MEEDNFISKKKSSKAPFFRQCFVTASVAINIVGHGCVIGFPAILNPALRLETSYIHATPSEESWIASICGFALILGNIITTPLMDLIGRKRLHILTTLPILVGWFSLLLAQSVQGIIVARFLQGISMGMLGPLSSIIIGEMTEPVNRGAFLSIVSLSLSIGVLTCHVVGIFTSWQVCALMGAVISFTSLVLACYAPDSPPWLLAQGRVEECREVFRWLRGTNERQEIELEAMIRAQTLIRKSSVAGQTLSFSVRTKRFFNYLGITFRKPDFYKPVIIMLFLYMMFQFAGINVFSSYMKDIIKQLVGPDIDANFWMITFGVIRLGLNVIAVFTTKFFKRRVILFTCTIICILTYLTKALYVYCKMNNLLPFDSKWIPLGLITLYLVVLAIGINTIPFALSGELFPLEYRGTGGGLSVLALSLNFFVAVKCFPVAVGAIGLPLTYCLYASVVLFCMLVVWSLLPETKGKTLQEIEDEFRGASSVDRKISRDHYNGGVIRYSLARRCSSQNILY